MDISILFSYPISIYHHYNKCKPTGLQIWILASNTTNLTLSTGTFHYDMHRKICYGCSVHHHAEIKAPRSRKMQYICRKRTLCIPPVRLLCYTEQQNYITTTDDRHGERKEGW